MSFLKKRISLNLLAGIIFSLILIAGFYFGFDSRGALSDRNHIIGEPVAEGIVAVHDFSLPFTVDELQEEADEIEASSPVYLRWTEQTGLNSAEQIRELILLSTENEVLALYFAQRVSSLYATGIIDIQALRTTYNGSHAIADGGPVVNISELFTLAEARDGIRLDLERRGVPHEEIPQILALIVPDLEIDSEAREAAVQELTANLPSIKRDFVTGEEILPPGGLFTEEISLSWDAMVLSPVSSQGVIEHNIAKTALAALLLIIGLLFVWREHNYLFLSLSDVSLLFTIWALSMGLTIILFHSGVRELSVFSFSMLGASLTSVFFDSRSRMKTMNYSWFFAGIFSSIFALVSPHPVASFMIGFIPACFVSSAIRDLSDRHTSNSIILGISFSIFVYWLLAAAGSSGSMHFSSAIWLALVALPVVIVGIVKVISHPLELIFHVATARTYERLSNDNHPLRDLLRREARGTYAHSLVVGELASAAAEELGADATLANLGGVFHDIGKLNKPEMFIENISNPDENNPHLHMSPSESAKIIIDHVSNGVELAEKHMLPADICDIIKQHHGDTSARFFLEKARKEVPPGGEFDEASYHYNGPKPRSVEAALVLLADSVSSAVKGLGSSSSYEEKSAVVFRIIKEKSEEGQFDECNLTGSMRTRAAHVFMDVLSQNDYERVKNYPHGK